MISGSSTDTVGPGRHSSSWVVQEALRRRGFAPPEEAIVFGLGGSPWYRFDDGVLRGLHPDRIKKSFYALNIWSVRFQELSSEAPEKVRERADQGLQTILLVDYRRLVGAPPVVDCGADFALLVTGSEGKDFWVQGPGDAVPWPIAEAELVAAWYRPDAGSATATYFWHPVVELRWSPSAALHRACRRIADQLAHGHPSLGATGLLGLERFIESVAAGHTERLAATALLAREDGGTGFHRDLTADFFRLAAQQLECPALDAVAQCFETSAEHWRGLLSAFLEPIRSTHALERELREVLRLERLAVENLGALRQLAAAKEETCLG